MSTPVYYLLNVLVHGNSQNPFLNCLMVCRLQVRRGWQRYLLREVCVNKVGVVQRIQTSFFYSLHNVQVVVQEHKRLTVPTHLLQPNKRIKYQAGYRCPKCIYIPVYFEWNEKSIVYLYQTYHYIFIGNGNSSPPFENGGNISMTSLVKMDANKVDVV